MKHCSDVVCYTTIVYYVTCVKLSKQNQDCDDTVSPNPKQRYNLSMVSSFLLLIRRTSHYMICLGIIWKSGKDHYSQFTILLTYLLDFKEEIYHRYNFVILFT